MEKRFNKLKAFQSSSTPLLLILIIISIMSLVISVILYLFLIDSSEQIEEISLNYVGSNSINTIKYLQELIENKIEVVNSNIDILSNLNLIKQQNLSAFSNLEVAQSITNDLTEGYGWVDENGKVIFSTTSDENQSTFQSFSNINVSESHYKSPEETYKPFISSEASLATAPNHDQVPRIVISYPILSLKSNSTAIVDENNSIGNTTVTVYKNPLNKSKFNPFSNTTTEFLKSNFDFKGVVAASIDSAKFSNFIENNILQVGSSNVINNNENTNTGVGNGGNVEEQDKVDNKTTSKDNYEGILDGNNENKEDKNILQQPLSSSSFIITLFDTDGLVLYSNEPTTSLGTIYNSSVMLKQVNDTLNEDKNMSNTMISNLDSIFSSNKSGNNTDNEDSNSSSITTIPNSIQNTLDEVTRSGLSIFDPTQFIINFQPISLNGKPILYLSTATPFTLSDRANNLLNDEIFYIFLFIGSLLSIVFGFITIVILVNKRLKHEVNNKTKDLQQNMDKLEKSNQKLLQSEQKEREFINIAAHELRTPTQAITGYSELNEMVFNDLLNSRNKIVDQKIKEDIMHIYNGHQSISKNASRLNNLINNLLDVARFESDNSVKLYKEKVDLIKEVKDVIYLQLNQKIRNKDIIINFFNDSLGQSYWVNADKQKLHQILINLLDNAVKFSNQNGNIDILIKEGSSDLLKSDTVEDLKSLIGNKLNDSKGEEKEQIYIAISDSGQGISPRIIPGLFEKFTTDSESGTGLGLFIARKLVEVMGGRIWAFNNSNGKGSTFVFSLPKIDDTRIKNEDDAAD